MAKEKKKGPRLPAQQLTILAAVRFAEPLALTSVFPYLPEMIKSFGIPKEEIARWAGMVSAIFSISQSATAVPWGWASDRIGRKPILVIGLFSTMVCFLFWGMATSLPMALVVRGIQGSSNGNIGIIRTMVAEMVPEKSLQPRAFALMPMVWSIGSVFGPSFGGFFVHPAEQFPGVFGGFALLRKYPYLLPNLIAFVVFIISLLAAILFLEETLETRRYSTDWGLELGDRLTRLLCGGRSSKKSRLRRAQARTENRRHRRRASRDDGSDDEASAPLLSAIAEADQEADLPLGNAPSRAAGRYSLQAQHVQRAPPGKTGKNVSIFTYQTSMALVCYTFLALHSVASDQLLPVFLNYPLQTPDATNTRLPFKFSGGFGMSAGRIGTIFTINALISGVAQFLAFPPLCARYGAVKCYRVGAWLLPVVYLVTPYTVLVQNEHLRYAAVLAAFLCKGMVSILTFPGITMILTNSAPSVKVLGTLNGFATTFSGVGRATGPAMAGAAFSWGVKRGYVITGWWFLGSIAVAGAIATIFLEGGTGMGGEQQEGDDDDEQEAALDHESGGRDAEHGTATPYYDISSDEEGVEEEEYRRDDGGLDSGCYRDGVDEAVLAPSSPLTESPTHSRTASQHWIARTDAALPVPTSSLFAHANSMPSLVSAQPQPRRASHAQLPRLRPLRAPDDPVPAAAEDAGGAAAAAEDAAGLLHLEAGGASAAAGPSSPRSSSSPVRGRRLSLLTSRRGRHDGPAAAVATGTVMPLSPVGALTTKMTWTESSAAGEAVAAEVEAEAAVVPRAGQYTK